MDLARNVTLTVKNVVFYPLSKSRMLPRYLLITVLFVKTLLCIYIRVCVLKVALKDNFNKHSSKDKKD